MLEVAWPATTRRQRAVLAGRTLAKTERLCRIGCLIHATDTLAPRPSGAQQLFRRDSEGLSVRAARTDNRCDSTSKPAGWCYIGGGAGNFGAFAP